MAEILLNIFGALCFGTGAFLVVKMVEDLKQ